ncbi:unnamed protein product, partial [Phaeothamnion confervicola]
MALCGERYFVLTTSWKDNTGKMGTEGNMIAVGDAIIVPLAKNIRVPATTIYAQIQVMTSLSKFVAEVLKDAAYEFTWDLQLFSDSGIKSFWRQSTLSNARKRALLIDGIPPYVWLVSCSNSSGLVFHMLFDATD